MIITRKSIRDDIAYGKFALFVDGVLENIFDTSSNEVIDENGRHTLDEYLMANLGNEMFPVEKVKRPRE